MTAIEPRSNGIASPRAFWPVWRLAILVAALSVAMGTLALIRPLDHDESQYVAAAQLAAHSVPYRDFPYLQTPLQPALLAPLSVILPFHLFVALRLVNALCGVATILLLYLALIRAGTSNRTATLVAGLMALCEPFLFASAVARNDALPAMLFCGALALLAGPPSRAAAFLTALLIASAAAAKISYAAPMAALLGLALAGRPTVKDRLPRGPVVAGLAIPALFVLGLAALAPDAFVFEVWTYAVQAPSQWYPSVGQAKELGLERIGPFVLNGVKGPALIALLMCAFAAWRSRREQFKDRPLRVIFGTLLVASLIAAFLPNPTQAQYWVPALPPLFLCLGLALDRGLRLTKPIGLLLSASACAGVATSARGLWSAAVSHNYPALTVERNAEAMRRLLDLHGIIGPIAGLNPELFADTGRPIDPRFATGPFLFRTKGLITADEARRWSAMPMNQVQMFAQSPPAAVIVTAGVERYKGSKLLRLRMLDAAMKAGLTPAGDAGGMILLLPRRADRSQR